jgi:DNA primase
VSRAYEHLPDHGYHRLGRHDPVAAAAARGQWAQRANEVRARVRLQGVVERVVRLKRAGAALQGLCPFHDEKTGSFTVYPKKDFFLCYGCRAGGDVIAFVMRRQGLDFKAAIELLESENGLRHLQAATPAPALKVVQAPDRQKLERAQRIWRQSLALERDGAVDRYLRGRCLVPPSDYGVGDAGINAGWPVDLRYEPRCWHDIERREYPALVAAIRGYDGQLLTVHRTYLVERADGGVGKAAVEKAKLVVGTFGPGFIRLGPDADAMTGGEGIETSLSAMQLWRRSGICFVNSGRMKSVEPPFACSDFIYAADKGGKGRWGEVFARAGAQAFGVGRTVAVKIPNIAADKGDFNDLLQARARGDHAPPPAAETKTLRAASPPTKPLKPAPARVDREADALVARLDDVGRGERAARLRCLRARAALAIVDRKNEAALAAAQAELDEATAIWKRALAGKRVIA